MSSSWSVAWLLLLSVCACTLAKKPEEKPDWAKKDITDFTDADLERLYDQWEEDDDPLPLDELPEHDPRRPQPMVDFSKLDMSNTESVMRATKKGKTLMMFVAVSDNPTREETEQLTSIWQTGLWNTHVQTDRFMLDDDRVIFMFKDGDMAWEAKDYMVEQERCEEVQLEQITYCGKFSKTCEQKQKEKKEKEEKEKKEREAKEKKEKKKKEKKEKEEKEKAKKEKKEKKDKAKKEKKEKKDEL